MLRVVDLIPTRRDTTQTLVIENIQISDKDHVIRVLGIMQDRLVPEPLASRHDHPAPPLRLILGEIRELGVHVDVHLALAGLLNLVVEDDALLHAGAAAGDGHVAPETDAAAVAVWVGVESCGRAVGPEAVLLAGAAGLRVLLVFTGDAEPAVAALAGAELLGRGEEAVLAAGPGEDMGGLVAAFALWVGVGPAVGAEVAASVFEGVLGLV